jgi:hypothetical protein
MNTMPTGCCAVVGAWIVSTVKSAVDIETLAEIDWSPVLEVRVT